MDVLSCHRRVVLPGRDRADGVLPSANVPRPSASSFISLRGAHHRRDPSAFVSEAVPHGPSVWHHTTSPVPRALGGPRSEVKEEAKPGDMSGGDYPVASVRAKHSCTLFPRSQEQQT